MKDHFRQITRHACGRLRGREVLLANFAAEVSDFVRFNRGQVRQPMTVRQAQLELTLIDGQRHNQVTLTISGLPAIDQEQIDLALDAMRAELPSLPEDPYLLYSSEATTSERITTGQLPTPRQAIDEIVADARGTDLVGILSSGPIQRGFASSLGAFHWHAVDAFLFDWSLYHATDKAVKCAWSGSLWDRAELRRRLERAREDLAHLTRPARTLEPGEYRTYLSPAAMDELLWMLNWGGVSAKAQRTKQSCIQHLTDGRTRLSPLISLKEDTAGGLAPAFDAAGFTKPQQVALVEAGAHAGSMVSPRTGAEYAIAANGADDDEGMASMTLAGGTLAEADALSALDTGIAVGNLHYLNFSDRSNGRVTGMTRFATFWVERGQIVAPINVMRWDDTLYRMLGDSLEALTDTPQWILNNSTYEQRSVQTSRVPGALLSRLAYTL